MFETRLTTTAFAFEFVFTFNVLGLINLQYNTTTINPFDAFFTK